MMTNYSVGSLLKGTKFSHIRQLFSYCEFNKKWHNALNLQQIQYRRHGTVDKASGQMTPNQKNALVPAGKKNLPAVRKPSAPRQFRLVDEAVKLSSREDVRERLPDILGKALAMIWIDKEFAKIFASDPQATLEAEGIILPDNMAIEFQKPDTNRPRIVVYEKRPKSNFRLRILYLQLVMMAGR